MAGKRKSPLQFEDVEVDMTPMIDMVFLLLIFFMFTATFNDINIDKAVSLPDAEAAQPDSRKPGTLVINIHKDDDGIYMNGRHYSRDELLAFLQSIRAKDAEHQIVIRGDGRAFHRNLIHVMECCAMAGMLNVRVAVTKERIK
ncbi:MAG: biopolymer transporter ExbD [Planctomycetes bacterium]|nr:biopolymer transporter ExbD [Planctomycetota bacterium]